MLQDDRQKYSIGGATKALSKLVTKLNKQHSKRMAKQIDAVDNTQYFDFDDAIKMLDEGDITIAQANQMLKQAGYPEKDVQEFTRAYSGLIFDKKSIKTKKEDPRLKELTPPTEEEIDKMLDEAVARGDFKKGGLLNDDRVMYKEGGMLPDEDMEDNYTRFIMDEALTEEEEDMLMSKLEQDEELAMIFDKVIDVAQEFAGAGPVEGPGSGVSDSIPARLSDGEFVFTAKAVEEIGADNLMAMMKDAEAKADERQPLQEGGELKEETMAMKTPMTEQVIRVEKGPQTEQVGVSGSLLDSVREEENPLYEEMAFKRPPVHGAGYGR
jgi:hypothetical protein